MTERGTEFIYRSFSDYQSLLSRYFRAGREAMTQSKSDSLFPPTSFAADGEGHTGAKGEGQSWKTKNGLIVLTE